MLLTDYNGTSGSAPSNELDYYYDDSQSGSLSVGTGHYHNLIEEDYTGSNVTSTFHLWSYTPNDQVLGGATATLSYDALNRLTEYNAGSSSQESYVYDARSFTSTTEVIHRHT